jgi:hypothetical protein
MKGTEKQIEWANNIKQEIVKSMDDFIAAYVEPRISETDMPEYYLLICVAVKKDIENKLNAMDAKQLIEQKTIHKTHGSSLISSQSEIIFEKAKNNPKIIERIMATK